MGLIYFLLAVLAIGIVAFIVTAWNIKKQETH